MKRALIILLVLTLVLASFACSKKEAPAKPVETIAEEQADLETDKPTEAPTEAPTDLPEEPSEEPTEEPTEVAEEPVEESDDMTIVIGKPIAFDDFEIVITELKIVKTWDNKQALRITYDWTNTSDEENAPYLSLTFKGFQNKVETESIVISDDIDSGSSVKKVKPGGTITGAHGSVGIDDVNAPLLVELSELFSWNGDAYSLEIEDLNEYK